MLLPEAVGTVGFHLTEGDIGMTGLTRRGVTALLGAAFVSPALVHADIFKAEGPTFAVNGRALRGIDVLSYFEGGQPVDGADAHATAWRGALWCFDSAAHQAAFEANPRAYAPKYGGYCAYAMSMNMTLSSDPVAWAIRGGRLYLFHSADAQTAWMTDPDSHIARADGYWPAIMHRLAD